MEENTISILLVEDDPEFVAILRQLLVSFQNRKFEITCVGDGEAALAKLSENHNVDVVLMDYFLPNENGVEITRRISERHIEVPIILLTSNKDFRIAVEAMKYGMEEYLVKDAITNSVLPRTIMNVVERHALKKSIAEAEKAKMLSQKKAETVQELVVTMCHEFNNPLAAIKISADILKRQQISDEERDLLDRLNKNISDLEKQIVKLRDINQETPA